MLVLDAVSENTIYNSDLPELCAVVGSTTLLANFGVAEQD